MLLTFFSQSKPFGVSFSAPRFMPLAPNSGDATVNSEKHRRIPIRKAPPAIDSRLFRVYFSKISTKLYPLFLSNLITGKQ